MFVRAVSFVCPQFSVSWTCCNVPLHFLGVNALHNWPVNAFCKMHWRRRVARWRLADTIATNYSTTVNRWLQLRQLRGEHVLDEASAVQPVNVPAASPSIQ